MALARDLSVAQMGFEIEGGDRDQFHVIRYRGTEGLCRLFQFELEVSVLSGDLDFVAIVGTSARLTIATDDGERSFRGMIARFQSTGQSNDEAFYRVELVPRAWLLTQRYQSRIFQNQTTQQIIDKVIEDSGLPADYCHANLTATYQPREYCVQYRETDYNFICRLMEEDGIWWYFEHAEAGDKLALADSVSAYQPITGEAELPFRPPTGMNVSAEHVYRFSRGEHIRPGAVAMNDFNFTNPGLALDAHHDLQRDQGLEFSDFPGEYGEQSAGTNLAQIRAEEFEVDRITATGQSNCYRLAPAKTFDLTEHPLDSHNDSYLITAVTYCGSQAGAHTLAHGSEDTNLLDHETTQMLSVARHSSDENTRALAEGLHRVAAFMSRLIRGDPAAQRTLTRWCYHGGKALGELSTVNSVLQGNVLANLNALDAIHELRGLLNPSQPLYECEFECVPASVVFRPPRLTPWPVMRGTQTARVVGPSGEEIHTDEYGRVKVQFHWDLQGAEGGTPKRFGADSSCWIRVAQGFAGGGYGMLFLPRVGQEVIVDFLEGDPDRPIIVGRVFNADHMPPYTLPDEKTKSVIKTHSTKGGGGTNEIRFEDLKDKEQLLINAQKDFHLRAAEEERHNVGKIQHQVVGDEQRLKIGKHRSVDVAGKDALHVADTRNLVVDGDVIEDFKANHGQQVASQYYIKANEVVVEADSGISLKVGGNFVVINASGVSVTGTQVGINSGGAALSKSASTSPASPAEPQEADTVTPGQDKSYTGEPAQPPPIEPKEYEGHWVAFNLKDKAGEPVAGEYFEITKPNGQVVHGSLDVNGHVRIWCETAGDCEIAFPNMDASEWSKA